MVQQQMVQQIGNLVQFLLDDFNGGAASSTGLRKLIPEIRESETTSLS
jgi:hypothetical protein